MVELSIRSVSKHYDGVVALDGVTLNVKSGEFVTLLGPSGCGKTTLLRIIAGLVDPTSGSVTINDRDVTHIPTHRRNIGMVFQSHALFSHMRVVENVAFGLKMRGVASEVRMDSAQKALEMVRLSTLGNRYPHELSGGQQQRVALARALVFNPDVLLLDEPFAALDRSLRESMQDELATLSRKVGITSIFVTHDQEEALVLSDRVVVMNKGKVEQVGTPIEVFNRPTTKFVADFMGGTNIFEFGVKQQAAGGAVLTHQGLSLHLANVPDRSGDVVEVMLRPEKIYLATDKPAHTSNWVAGRITSSVFHGAYTSVQVALPGFERPIFVQHRLGQPAIVEANGRHVYVVIPDEAVHLLD
jgi:putative spermidine/putrescine transport system ATP-binding protein